MKQTQDAHGFVTQWLTSGPATQRYIPPQDLPRTWTDQLGYEKTLRGIFYKGTQAQPPMPARPGEDGPAGAPWQCWYSHGGWFVDVSTFYSLLTCVRLDAATVLNAPRAQSVPAVFWTYTSLEVWVNGQKVLRAQPPVYKPIARYDVVLPLRAGANEIYVLAHNLGVRDTRTLFGLQLKGGEGVTAQAPGAALCASLGRWLDGLRCAAGQLCAASGVPEDAGVKMQCGDGQAQTLTGAGPWALAAGAADVTVQACSGGQTLVRRFELPENLHPLRLADTADHYRRFLERLAARKWEPRGNGVHFNAFNVMARRALKCPRPDDDELLLQDLDFIESRGDCADFLVAAFVRLVHNYPVSAPVKTRLREVLLNFRYWMDENGDDGMCFWSENHALMFYGAQLIAGQMYPDDVFVRSGRTGAEQARIGAARCRAWLTDVERDGAEEFNSASYMPVTLAALLSLVDFAPADIAARAAAVLDGLLRQLCMHVFSESVISPQGRVYRDVIYPSRQTVQSLLHLIDPALPYSAKESIWCVCFDTTHYRFPAGLPELMRAQAHKSYVSGNARIEIDKTDDYILTSVHSPRDQSDAPDWVNECFVENADKSTNQYVKSLNERFHGTSVFEPGVYGYQQHLWYAAVSNEAVVFVTHPGSSVDFDGMRPGYWYGNGVFPAVRQQNNVLGAVYELPENHPICFTHTFWPAVKFDESMRSGHWLFGRVKNGYVGLWCSGEQVPYSDALPDCEYRCYETGAAYCCVCGSAGEDGSFEAFRRRCDAIAPRYDRAQKALHAGALELRWTPHTNRTQFI